MSIGLVLAGGEADEGAVEAAFVGHAVLAAQLHALEVLLEDEVDHAGHRIGAVHARHAAGHHLHALDPFHRDGVDVDRGGAGAGTHVAAAVDQHQGAGRAHAAQVQQAEARGADEAGGIAQGVGGRQRRHPRHQVADVGGAGAADFLGGDRGHRGGGDEAGAGDARAGDDHLVQLGGCAVLGPGFLGEGGTGEGCEQCHHQGSGEAVAGDDDPVIHTATCALGDARMLGPSGKNNC